MIVFAAFSPHPPLLLPEVGSAPDRAQVKKTIASLASLGQKLKKTKPDEILISAPHPDWGFNVPLRFLAPDFQGQIKPVLIELESPQFYFEAGQRLYQMKLGKEEKTKFALIASGDASHCLKADGPYGFQADGPKFDQSLVECLQGKQIEKLLQLDEEYPQAGECGLRSFAFLLGVLDAAGLNWQPEVLSYEGPFGVGYLVVNFQLHG